MQLWTRVPIFVERGPFSDAIEWQASFSYLTIPALRYERRAAILEVSKRSWFPSRCRHQRARKWHIACWYLASTLGIYLTFWRFHEL